MIEKLAIRLTELIDARVEEAEIIEYGFHQIILTSIHFFVAVFLGILWHRIWFSIFLYNRKFRFFKFLKKKEPIEHMLDKFL